MYDQFREDTLFCMLYAAVTMLSLNASCYLLFRRANAIAPCSVSMRLLTVARFTDMFCS